MLTNEAQNKITKKQKQLQKSNSPDYRSWERDANYMQNNLYLKFIRSNEVHKRELKTT